MAHTTLLPNQLKKEHYIFANKDEVVHAMKIFSIRHQQYYVYILNRSLLKLKCKHQIELNKVLIQQIRESTSYGKLKYKGPHTYVNPTTNKYNQQLNILYTLAKTRPFIKPRCPFWYQLGSQKLPKSPYHKHALLGSSS